MDRVSGEDTGAHRALVADARGAGGGRVAGAGELVDHAVAVVVDAVAALADERDDGAAVRVVAVDEPVAVVVPAVGAGGDARLGGPRAEGVAAQSGSSQSVSPSPSSSKPLPQSSAPSGVTSMCSSYSPAESGPKPSTNTK